MISTSHYASPSRCLAITKPNYSVSNRSDSRNQRLSQTLSVASLPQKFSSQAVLSKPALTQVKLPGPTPQNGLLLYRRQRVYLEHAIKALRLEYQKLPIAQQKLDWHDAVAVMRLCHQLSGNNPKRFAELCREALFNKEWGLEKPSQSKQSFSDHGIQDQFADPYNPDGQLFHIMELALPASSNSKKYYGGLANPSWVMGFPGGYQLIRYVHEVLEVKVEHAISSLAKFPDWLLGTHLHQKMWPTTTSRINPGLTIGDFHWRDWNTYPHSAKMHKLFRTGQIEASIRYLETQMLLPTPRRIEFKN